MRLLKILVVDDNLDNQRAAQVQLVGHDVTVVGDLQSFYQSRNNAQWDLVITDLFFPKETGYGEAQALGALVLIWAQEKKIPCRIVTNNHGECEQYVLEDVQMCNGSHKNDERGYPTYRTMIEVDDISFETAPFIERVRNMSDACRHLDGEAYHLAHSKVTDLARNGHPKYKSSNGVTEWSGVKRVKNYRDTLKFLGFF